MDAMPGNPMARERRRAPRSDHDFFRTPPHVTQALLDRESFPGVVWEPACGDGAMARAIEATGYGTWATDLVDRGYGDRVRVDFLLEQRMPVGVESIVTNPPFKLATEFVQHALDLGARKVAVLCRTAFLEGVEREQGIHRSLSRVWILSRRTTLWHGDVSENARRGADGRERRGSISFAWFVWERHHRGPVVGFIA